MAVSPTLELETHLLKSGVRWVIGCDEVGRGAIAGSVAVGVALIDLTVGEVPEGLCDSKLLSEKRREALAPVAKAWVQQSAVGHVEADEVDSIGISKALGLAGKRALAALHEAGADILSSAIILDGSHNWLGPALNTPLQILTRPKADRDCAVVSAASVIAKVDRDRTMIEADAIHPGYHWAANKGYGSAAHLEAIATLGPTPMHRHTWLKPTLL